MTSILFCSNSYAYRLIGRPTDAFKKGIQFGGTAADDWLERKMGFGQKPPVFSYWFVLVTTIALSTSAGADWVSLLTSEMGIPAPNVSLPMDLIVRAGDKDILKGGTFDAELNGTGYSTLPGVYGNATRFNGTGHAVYPDAKFGSCFEETSTTTCNQGLTVMLWLQTDGVCANVKKFFQVELDNNTERFLCLFMTCGDREFGARMHWSTLWSDPLFDNQWYHVVVTHHGRVDNYMDMWLYLNGKPVGGSYFSLSSTSEIRPTLIGADDNEEQGGFTIDELHSWREPLTEDQIADIYRLYRSRLGSDCATDADCPDHNNMRCGEQKSHCVCKAGYKYIAKVGSCVIESPEDKICTTDEDCQLYDQRMICDGTCACRTRHIYNELTHLCVDYDECAANSTCNATNASCVNTVGGYECSCNADGLAWNETLQKCEDINECSRGNSGCMYACKNTVGSFHCSCAEGFSLSHDGATCLDNNECERENGNCSQICVNSYGSRVCSCQSGFRLGEDDMTCDPVVSKVGENCLLTSDCTFHDGNSLCSPVSGECECKDGFQYFEDGRSCVKDGTYGANCTENSNCTDIPHLKCEVSSERCLCKEGYHYRSGTCFLVAVHGTECVSAADCQIHEETMVCDTLTKVCVCSGGYEYDRRYLACLDVDECTRANGGCEQKCANSLGSFECGCNSGYELEPDERNCTDVNECILGNGGCMQTCENTEGSFHCSCADGFILSRDGASCLDDDECESDNGNCSHICVNSYGSRMCLCRNNFRLEEDGVTCSASAVETDGCSDVNGGCQHRCLDEDGSLTCACHTGYVLNEDQKSCRDNDECADRNGGCEHVCLNSPGSRYCSCRPGYMLDVDGASCYLDGNIGKTSVKIRFRGTYLEWMFDFFSLKVDSFGTCNREKDTPSPLEETEKRQYYGLSTFLCVGIRKRECCC